MLVNELAKLRRGVGSEKFGPKKLLPQKKKKKDERKIRLKKRKKRKKKFGKHGGKVREKQEKVEKSQKLTHEKSWRHLVAFMLPSFSSLWHRHWWV